MNSKLRIIISGLIAQYPIGGVTWDYLQYVLGLVRLGHDVFYIEDSGQWPYNPIEGGKGTDATFNVDYLAGIMARFGLADRWAYHFPGGSLPTGEIWQSKWFGISDSLRNSVVQSADILINVSSGLGDPSQYSGVPRLAYVDTDPVFTQVRLGNGEVAFQQHVDAHDVHFSYGECLSQTGPFTGHDWRPIRKPIFLSEWTPLTPRREVFTTVMNWTSYKDVNYQGRSYGQKDVEFMRFVDLPEMITSTVIELALGSGKTRRAPTDLLAQKGWHLVSPAQVCPDFDSYRHYIESSKAEWTVAKNGYVLGRTGWFSGRTACYLAAGRPVVVQDTGFDAVLPVGEGILQFNTLEEAAMGIQEVEGNYARHAKAARSIAEEYFDSDKVLNRLITRTLNPGV